MMERYKEYKDSGVKWLGEIPSHWEVVKLKRCAIIKTGTTPPTSNLKYFENGDIPWFTPGDINDMNLHFSSKTITKKAIKDNVGRLFPAESIYFVGIGATVEKVAACDFEASSNQQINAIMCNDRLDYKFATYCLLMEQGIIRETTNFVTLPILNQSSTGLIDIVLPPLPEQDSIVRYLDSATSEIDKAIAMQQKMIDLLNERKQIIIQNAVTKGLDENVEMKESGVEWIGRIPKHWEVEPFSRHLTFGKGLPITKANLQEEGIAVISYGQIHAKNNLGTTLTESLVRYVSPTYIETHPQCLLKGNDFIFADTSEDIEGSGNFAFNDFDNKIFAGYHTVVAKPNDLLFPKYYAYLFKSKAWKSQIQSLVNGVKVYSIGRRILKTSMLLIPSEDEQKNIVKFLDKQTSAIEKTIETISRQITLLQERKQIIINEVVTGKVRVS